MEDELPTCETPFEESPGDQVEEVLCGPTGESTGWPRRVGLDGVDGVGVPQRVGEERDLPVVEIGSPEELDGLPRLGHLSTEVDHQLFYRPSNHLELVKDEVRRVELVRLG